MSTLQTELVATLRGQLAGRVTGPGEEGWEDARRPWHLLVDQHPAAVVEVAGVDDIRAAVRIAAAQGLSVTAQPNGHGAAAGAADGTILLRTGALDELAVDLEACTIRVGAGVRWRDVGAALAGTGWSALPGSSDEVTVVGYLLGGGLSWFGRRYGWAAEHITAVELITASGEPVRVTHESDPDLFWALRGGGGDFGIVTAVELRLVQTPELYGGRLVWPVEQAAAVLRAAAGITRTAPEELTVWSWLLNVPDLPTVPAPLRGRWVVAVDLTHLGSGEEAEQLIAPLRALPAPLLDGIGPLSVDQVGDISQEPQEPTAAVIRVRLLEDFPDDAATTLTALAVAGTPLALVGVRHLGGALAYSAHGTDDDLTAEFGAEPEGRRRGAAEPIAEPYLLVIGAIVPDPALTPIARAVVDGAVAAMAGWTSPRVLPSFAYGASNDALYSPDTLERLRAVKRRVDPAGVIRSNHPVLED